MGVIITGVMLVVLSIAFSLVLLDKLNISRQEIKKLEKTISEFRIVANKAEAKYRGEALRSRELEEVARESTSLCNSLLTENRRITEEWGKCIKLLELVKTLTF